MAGNWCIERATAENVVSWDDLLSFGKQEYKTTFGHLYTPEQLATYLEECYNETLYRSWLQDTEQFALFIAYDEGNKVCGYSLASTVCTLPLDSLASEDPASNHTKIENRIVSLDGELRRIYVRMDQCGSGLANALLSHAMDWLTPRSSRIFLGVYAGNPRAQRFYHKQGFVPMGKYPYPMIAVDMLLMQYHRPVPDSDTGNTSEQK